MKHKPGTIQDATLKEQEQHAPEAETEPQVDPASQEAADAASEFFSPLPEIVERHDNGPQQPSKLQAPLLV